MAAAQLAGTAGEIKSENTANRNDSVFCFALFFFFSFRQFPRRLSPVIVRPSARADACIVWASRQRRATLKCCFQLGCVCLAAAIITEE